MCGIIGFSGSHDPSALKAGVGALRHRGPDDCGVFLDDSSGVGLGHTRLSILDLSPLGHQPMIGGDGGAVLAYNGEIYNFRQLRQDLEGAGFQFKGHSDSEVLLNLYLAEGEAMLDRLNGMFAFALWDRRTHTLLLARDGLGVKPLYYAQTPAGIAFASEIKALRHLVPQLRELDAAALHRYLSFLWCPGEGTPLKSVRKLLPGEAMRVRGGRVEKRWSWYRPPAFRDIRADLSMNDAVVGTAAHLRQAVHRQMVADVPVGAFLSGGLDSSAVVAFAREVDANIRCFTIDAAGWEEEGTINDLPYARHVARHLSVALDVVRVDAARIAGDVGRMVAQLDEPQADPAALNVLYISRLAREQGVKVLLSGAGGDDLFTGYRRHRAVQAEPYLRLLPAAARQMLDRATMKLDRRRPFFRRLAKLFAGLGLEGDARLANYFLWARESDLLALYTPAFRAELEGLTAAQPLLDHLATLPDSVAPLERMLALEQRFFLADHNLLYTDKMSMAAGVEVRVPFLDTDLVDFAQRIPLKLKQRGSVGKWILKRAMEPFLPREIIYRPKTGFGAPIRHWMRHELRELLGDVLSPGSLGRRGLFDPDAVQRLVDRNERGHDDAAYTLFALLSIELWCRSYLDSGP
jgi:asparagine synthase (glutamine-hydrolysing)